MTREKTTTVLITGLGAPGAPGIIKSLRLNGERDLKIVGVDSAADDASGAGMVNAVYSVPIARDPMFIDSLLSICREEKVDVVIPLVTAELPVLADAIGRFEREGIKVQVSSPESLGNANNKFALMSFCGQRGIPVPEFRLVRSREEFEKKAFELGYPDRKICFKPPVSNGMRGFRVIDDTSERMEKLIYEKPDNVYIGYEEFLQIADDADFFPELLLMEYLPGEEYSVDVLVENGNYIASIPRSREKIKMGISFVGVAVNDEEIMEYSRMVVEALGLHGNIGLQFRRDAAGVPKLIESNPRVQGTIVLCTAAGYNMVYNSVKLALGEPLPTFDPKWGTKMVRYWEEIFFDRNGKGFRL